MNLKTAWKAWAQQSGTSTGVAAIKRLASHIAGLGYAPTTLDDAGIEKLLAGLIDRGRPNPKAETNSFIAAYNAIIGYQRLSPLPTWLDQRRDALAELYPSAFFIELDEQVEFCARAGLVAHNIHSAILRMANAVRNAGLPVVDIGSLITEDAIDAIVAAAVPTDSSDHHHNPINEPSPARVRYLSLLAKIAARRGDPVASTIVSNARKFCAGIDPGVPVTTLRLLAAYRNPEARDAQLAKIASALRTGLKCRPSRRDYYERCGELALLTGFFTGRKPGRLASLGLLVPGSEIEDGGAYLAAAGHHEPAVWVPREIVALIDEHAAWVERYRAQKTRHRLFEGIDGAALDGQMLAHHINGALRRAGSKLCAGHLRDWAGFELLRARAEMEHLRDYLGFASTDACQKRFESVRSEWKKHAYALDIIARAGNFEP